jgi:hypothetical protein
MSDEDDSRIRVSVFELFAEHLFQLICPSANFGCYECEYMPRRPIIIPGLVGMFSPLPSVFWNNNVQACLSMFSYEVE